MQTKFNQFFYFLCLLSLFNIIEGNFGEEQFRNATDDFGIFLLVLVLLEHNLRPQRVRCFWVHPMNQNKDDREFERLH